MPPNQELPFRLLEHLEPLRPGVEKFLDRNPDYERNVFVMMRFKNTHPFPAIHEAIDVALTKHGFKCLRADKGMYEPFLWNNVRIHMVGCKYGIVVFEDVDEGEFNPNVSMELGFMLALGKELLILKETKLRRLPSDIAGYIYKEFDESNINASIKMQIDIWVASMDPTGVGARFRKVVTPTSFDVADAPRITPVKAVITRTLRGYFGHSPPDDEGQITRALKVILSAAGLEFTEECEDIHYDGRCSRPALASKTSGIAIQVKLCSSTQDIKRVVAEMVADSFPLRHRFTEVLFLVYDSGFITQDTLIRTHVENQPGVHLVIVKHKAE